MKSDEVSLLPKPGSFPLSAGELRYQSSSALFQSEQMHSGESWQRLQAFGGCAGLSALLGSSLRFGLTPDSEELTRRRECFGANTQAKAKHRGVISLAIEAVSDILLLGLIGAAGLSLVVGLLEDPGKGWIDSFIILLAVALVVSITTAIEYMKQLQFVKLNAAVGKTEVGVVRGGRDYQIPSEELVVGDILHIRSGDIPQADGALFHGSLVADESAMTGESALIRKTALNSSPFLLSGTQIVEGNGLALVLAVGQWSQLGKSKAMLLASDGHSAFTPLQGKLRRLARAFGLMSCIGALVVLCIFLIYLLIHILHTGKWDGEATDYLANGFFVVVTLAVVAVPEGLPLAVTLSLAFSVIEMKKEHNFVKNLHACEVMAAVTSICSDKTGTLTLNKLTVQQVWVDSSQMTAICEGNSLAETSKLLILENICCNSTAFFARSEETGLEVESGSRLECALLAFAGKNEADYRLIRCPESEIVQFPFDSARKKSTTVLKRNEKLDIYTKGAGEVVLALCKYILRADGSVSPLDEAKKEEIRTQFALFSRNLMKIVAFAHTFRSLEDTTVETATFNPASFEVDMVFDAIITLEDPIRPEVPASIACAQRAGVVVRMITGDNLGTAVRRAKECGILPGCYDPSPLDFLVLTGAQLREQAGGLIAISDPQGKIIGHKVNDLVGFRQVATRVRVLACATPEDKFLLVTGLQQCGETVAVTGDGTNDAPALRKADVGLAMHLSGTPLAREAADIVLLDDNFASVVSAVKWGRNTYDGIRRFLQFQLTSNLVAIFMILLSVAVLSRSPLTTVQLLWLNLMIDSLGAIALAISRPTARIMLSQPIRSSESLITPVMWLNIAFLGLYQCLILTILLFAGPKLLNVQSGWEITDWLEESSVHFTIFFNVFVLLAIGNEVNCRQIELEEVNPFSNQGKSPLLFWMVAGELVGQYCFVQFGAAVLVVSPLSLKEHVICWLLGASIVPVGVLIKYSAALACKVRLNKNSDT